MNKSKAVEFTKSIAEDYFLGTIKTRCIDSDKRAGSYYDLSEDEILAELESQNWELDSEENRTSRDGNPEVVRYFKADLPGYFGMVDLDNLDSNQVLEVFEAKPGAQYLNIGLNADIADEQFDYSYLITSEQNGSGNEFILTFHPGPLINPEEVASDFGGKFSAGDKITVSEAKSFDLKYAKLF